MTPIEYRNVDFVSFSQRSDRSFYIATRFRQYLEGSVLDVGCDKAILRGLLEENTRYFGIDIGGAPDLLIDLERQDVLPFDTGAFSTIVCSDVLEHLDNLHAVFAELVRVSSRYIIVSLPNNWTNARRPIERGRGEIAHYGLPATRPRDRHKWFFSLSEAIGFMRAQESHFPVSIIDTVINEKPRFGMVRFFRRIFYPDQARYFNRYAHTIWAVFKKTS